MAGKQLKNPMALTKKPLLGANTLLMTGCAGLLATLFAIPVNPMPLIRWLFYALIILGSLCETVMLLAWQATFLGVSSKKAGLVYTGGVLTASLILFAGMVLPLGYEILLMTLLPSASLLLLVQQRQAISVFETPPTKNPPSARVFPMKLVLLITLFYTVGGLMFKLVGIRYSFAHFFWISNLSYLAVVVGAGLTVYYQTDMDLRLLSRPVLPLLTAGFILLPFLTENYAILSFLLLEAGFALFDMYTWLLIVYFACYSPRPLATLGSGMALITLAMGGGNLVFSIFAFSIPVSRQINTLSVTAGLLTLLASFIFPDKKETFAGWELSPGQSTPAPPPATEVPGDYGADRDDTVPNIPEAKLAAFLQAHNLTARETEVLLLLLKGRNNPFIREKLNISPNTLKYHLKNIYQKLEVTNRQLLLNLFDRE
jgi:DNA-binding CsgD family transcriptional regulator